MIKSLMVIHADGRPVYFSMQGANVDDDQALLSSFLAALQMFAKELTKGGDATGIKSITLEDTVYTFRKLELKTSADDGQYYFILLTEMTKNLSDLKEILEFLIMVFLGYNKGEFTSRLRRHSESICDFNEFNDFMTDMVGLTLNDIKKKKITLFPNSFVQGMLNEARDYIPANNLVTFHKKLVTIGPSYVWISDDLSPEEEDQIIEKLQQNLTRLYGPGLYKSMTERVERLLSGN